MTRPSLWLLILPGMVAGTGAMAAGSLELGGFVQLHAAVRTRDVDCPLQTACRVPFNDQRLRVNVEGSGLGGAAGFAGKLDFVHDAVVSETDVDLRELYGDYSDERYAARAGRQVITWGVGDLLFINDTFPKDWVAFFGGLPLEYLKLGSDALKLNLFATVADLELVLARFRRDNLPNGRRFVFDTLSSLGLPPSLDEPSDPEISVRLFRYLGSWDGALYFNRTHYRAPTLTLEGEVVEGFFPRLNTYGASLSGPLGNGVLGLEVGYYDSREDPDGTDPAIENSQMRFLVGYSRQVTEDTTLGVQGYVERMHDYDAYRHTLPKDFLARERLRTVLTLRFTQLHLHQTLTVNVFAFWGLSEEDAYLIPSLHYAFTDALWAEAGANVFLGSSRSTFGSLEDNDNVYLTVRYSF